MLFISPDSQLFLSKPLRSTAAVATLPHAIQRPRNCEYQYVQPNGYVYRLIRPQITRNTLSMSLRQLGFPKTTSGQAQTAKKQTRFRSLSFGRLPSRSKDLMYESVQDQPLPQSPLSTPRPSASILSSPAPSYVPASRDGNDYFAERSGSPTPRASRSTTMQGGIDDSAYAGSHHHTMSLPIVESPNEEDTSSWMRVFSRSKRGSKIFHRNSDGHMNEYVLHQYYQPYDILMF